VLPIHNRVEASKEFPGGCDCRKVCESPGKHPRTTNGLKDATTDIPTIERWFGRQFPSANIAISLAGAGLVDVAPDDPEWLAEFIARGLPRTVAYNSVSGVGHEHHLYRRPEGVPTVRECRSGEYDILSDGYALVPPSTGYYWLPGQKTIELVAPPVWATQILIEKVKRPKVAARDIDGDAEPEEDVARYVEQVGRDTWLGANARDRSGGLVNIAFDLLDAGANDATILAILAERDEYLGWRKYSDRRDPSGGYLSVLSWAKARHTPRLGRERNRRRDERQATVSTDGLNFMTFAELANSQPDEIPWIIPGVLGIGMITDVDGKAKTAGKTTFVLDMIWSILNEQRFIGRVTTYSPIVYLTEQTPISFKQNMHRGALDERQDAYALTWSDARQETWPRIVQQAVDKCREVDALVLVVDTLPQFAGLHGDDENSSGKALEVMRPLQAAAAGGLAILITRHDRKSGGEVGDSARGSSAFSGAQDIILRLYRAAPEERLPSTYRHLDGVGRPDGIPDNELVELVNGHYVLHGQVDAVVSERTESDLMPWIPIHESDGVTVDELAESTGQDRRRVWEALKRFVRAGRIDSSGKGTRGDPTRYFQSQNPPDED